MHTVFKWLVLSALFALPPATWAFFKPVRVLAPTLAGLDCPVAGICLDDLSRLKEASQLKVDATYFVESRLGPMRSVPPVIFCSTPKCGKTFGFTSNAGYNVGTFGVVIGPRGWKPFYIRHELIHHVQMERLGSWHAWLFTPTWFIEGMAYSMSDDPRRPLPEPLEGYRAKFESWYTRIEPGIFWSAAQAL